MTENRQRGPYRVGIIGAGGIAQTHATVRQGDTTMDPIKKVEIGKTGISLTRLGLGARGIVDPSVEVSDAQAIETVDTSFDVGINYIDTSPRYGVGRSEEFVGQVASRRNRDSFVLSTKVGRLLNPDAKGGWYWDFSATGVQRSLESSLERLHLEGVDILFIHSPTDHFEVAMAESYPVLAEMRSSSLVKAIGGGGNADEIREIRFDGTESLTPGIGHCLSRATRRGRSTQRH